MKIIDDAVSLDITRSTFCAEGIGAETVAIEFETQTPVAHGDWVEVAGHRGIVVQPEKNYVQWPYKVTALDPVSAKLKQSFSVPGGETGGRNGLYVLAVMQGLIGACGSSMTYDTSSALRFYYLPNEDAYEWDAYLKQVLQITGNKLSYDTKTGTYNLTRNLKKVELDTLNPSDVVLSLSYDKYINYLSIKTDADWIDQNQLEEVIEETFENEFQKVVIRRRGEQVLSVVETGDGGTRTEAYEYNADGYLVKSTKTEKTGNNEGDTDTTEEFTATDVVSDIQYKFTSDKETETLLPVAWDADGNPSDFAWKKTDRTVTSGSRNEDGSGRYEEDVYGWHQPLYSPTNWGEPVFRVVESTRVTVPQDIEYITKRPRSTFFKLRWVPNQPSNPLNLEGRYYLVKADGAGNIPLSDIPPLKQNIPYLRCSSKFECVAKDDISIAAVGIIDASISAQWIMTAEDLKALAIAELLRCAKCATIQANTLQVDDTLTIGDIIVFEDREYFLTSIAHGSGGMTLRGVGLLQQSEVAQIRPFVMSNTGWQTIKAIQKAQKQVDNLRMGTISKTIDAKSAMVKIEGIGDVYTSNYGGGELRTGQRVILGRGTGRGGSR